MKSRKKNILCQEYYKNKNNIYGAIYFRIICLRRWNKPEGSDSKGITKGIRKGTVPNCFSFHRIRESKDPLQGLSVLLMFIILTFELKNQVSESAINRIHSNRIHSNRIQSNLSTRPYSNQICLKTV